jgi:hypothetical protein
MSDELNNVIDGELHCPLCQISLSEKLPKDKRQIRKVVRFSCCCGYYLDVPIEDLIRKGMKFVN